MKRPERTPLRPMGVPPGVQNQSAQPSQRLTWRMLLIFLLGMCVGGGGLLLYLLTAGGERQPITPPSSPLTRAIEVQASQAYVAQLVAKNIASAGLPGTVKDVQVKLVQNGPMTVTGTDVVSILGIDMNTPFSADVQPYVQSCTLHIHILHVSAGLLPVTSMTSSLEDSINRQLASSLSGLPEGFTYCMSSVRTEPEGMYIDVAATLNK